MTPQSQKIRVLLCNRHNLFREGIKALFRDRTAIEIVGSAATTEHALILLRRMRPDVMLLDATTPGSGCSEVMRRVRAIDPNVAVLILSLYDDEVLISGCLDAGAAGFIRKNDEPTQLRQAITTVYEKAHHAAA